MRGMLPTVILYTEVVMSHGNQGESMRKGNSTSDKGDEMAVPACSTVQEKASVYRVNFGREMRGRKRPLDVAGLIGRGRITIDGTQISLSGSRSRFAFSGETEQVRIPLSKVFNAGRAGLQLRFLIDGEDGSSPQLVQFKMASLAEANQLL